MTSEDTGTDAMEIARASGRAMYERDNAAQNLGIELVDVAPGRARMVMTIREDMANGHGTCHGGVIFLFADDTFSYACNSYNQKAVARTASIEFTAAAYVGDQLTAVAEERNVTGRTGIYDVTVTNQDDETIALFRGISMRIRGEVVGDPAE